MNKNDYLSINSKLLLLTFYKYDAVALSQKYTIIGKTNFNSKFHAVENIQILRRIIN